MEEPQNNYEALVLGLKLAITAPSEQKAKECLKMVSMLDVSELEIERAKKEAVKQIEEEE